MRKPEWIAVQDIAAEHGKSMRWAWNIIQEYGLETVLIPSAPRRKHVDRFVFERALNTPRPRKEGVGSGSEE